MGPISVKLIGGLMMIFALSTSGAAAHIGATGVVKERMDTMSAMGKALGVIVDMIKGKTPYNAIEATQSASVLHDHAIDTEKQFPATDQSKNGKHSQALSAIWSERAEFDKLLGNLQIESEKLAQIAAMNNPALVRPQFAEVVEICSACHEKYRKAKQQ